MGYGVGINAPGRCSNREICPQGNSSTEPFICSHNVLLSHSVAVNLYRTKYQKQQKGLIGMTLNGDWGEPYSNSQQDLDASESN